MPAIIANMRSLYAAGALLVTGTDAGIDPSKPHDAQRFAVPEMAMTPMQALVAATSDAAKVCGLAHRKGPLRARFDADLIAAAGNPLEDSGRHRRPSSRLSRRPARVCRRVND